MVSQQLIPLFFLFFLLIKEGITLKCYSCSSEIANTSCLTPGPTTPTEECSGNQTMCRKIEQQIYYNKEDNTRILRQCATSGEVGECLERTGTFRYKSWYCQCKGELCNTANRIFTPFTIIVALLSLLGLRLVL